MNAYPNQPTPLSAYLAEGARIILVIFLAVAVIIFLVKGIITVSVPFSLDYGEGPLLEQAAKLVEGQTLYSTDVTEPPYTITNYPPLFMLMVSPFVKLFGPTLTAGRLISLLSTLATAVFLALIILNFTQDRLASVVTAVIFLACPFVVQWAGLMRVDMLALALSMAALYLLVRWPTARWNLIAAGLLLVAAIYTRQSYGLAAPLAAFVWLWRQERRRALLLLVLVGGLGLLLFAGLNLMTQGGFFFNIITANINTFSGLDYWLGELIRIVPILLALGGFFLILGWRLVPTMWSLLAAYLIGSLLTALTIGKIGANVNYFLELAAALALVAGTLLHWSRQQPWVYVGLLTLLSLQIGLYTRATLEGPVADLAFRRQDAGAMIELAELVAAVDGPVLADEHMALLPMQERPLYFQPFEMTQLSHDGQWQQQEFLASIQNQEFPLILIYQYPGAGNQVYEERWTPEMLAAIEEYYQPAQVLGGNILYRPLGETGTATTTAPAKNPTFAPDDVQVSMPRVIDQSAPGLLMPEIAANPGEPDHLAVGFMTVSDKDCTAPDCPIGVHYFISLDGGVTWNEQAPFDAGQQQLVQALVEFGPDNNLYALSLRAGQPFINRAQGAPYEMVDKAAQVGIIRNPFQPQLTPYPDSERLIFSYSGRIRDNMGVRLNISTDQGQSWSASTNVDEGVPQAEVNAARSVAPDNVQVLLRQGDDLAVAWRWDTGYWNWPLGVWMATSNDNGESFGKRKQIAETWGSIQTAAHEGSYYLLYRTGFGDRQQLAVAGSQDGGETWQAAVASGDQTLSYGFDHISGFDIAPDGTLDMAFYAPEGDPATCALDRNAWLEQSAGGAHDTCLYHLYYTYSRDGGQTFSEPVRINETSLSAEDIPGPLSVSISSTDPYVYAIWATASGDGGQQAVTVRIER